MPCPEFEEGLPGEDDYALKQHAAQCEACRSLLFALDEVDSALTATFSRRQVSPAFADSVFEKLHAQPPLRRPTAVPEMLDGVGGGAIVTILLWLAILFVPGLEFGIPLATAIGAMLLMAGFGIAYRCYGDLRRS